jgi:hypothetical protein
MEFLGNLLNGFGGVDELVFQLRYRLPRDGEFGCLARVPGSSVSSFSYTFFSYMFWVPATITVTNMAKAMNILLKMTVWCTAAKLRTSCFTALTSITGKKPQIWKLKPSPKSGCNVRNLGSCRLENNA